MDVSIIISSNKSDFLKQIHQYIKIKLKPKAAHNLSLFVDEFFEYFPLIELHGRSLDDVFGLIKDAYRFISTQSKRSKIQVYNPSIKQDGWQCSSTIILVHCKNTPFLMDSVRMALTNANCSVRTLNYSSLSTERNKAGDLVELKQSAKVSVDGDEALLYFEINQLHNDSEIKVITSTIKKTIADVALVNNSYGKILTELRSVQENTVNAQKNHSIDEIDEAKQFLSWLMMNNFTFLAYAYCDLTHQYGDKDKAKGSMGLLKNTPVIDYSHHFSHNRKAPKKTKALLTFSKLPFRSSVHRHAYPDHITVKAYSPTGQLIGEHHIVGLYTSGVYRASVIDIPIVRKKVQAIYEQLETNMGSYKGKVIRQVFETYPRDELFQSGIDELKETVTGIAHINERKIVRLFMRKESTNQFVYAMVYIPREGFSTKLREQVVALLSDEVGAVSYDFYTYYSESVLSRTYIAFRLGDKPKSHWNVDKLEQKVKDLARTWPSALHDVLIDHFGVEQGNNFYRCFSGSFSNSYQENFTVEQALNDIRVVHNLSDDKPLSLELCEPEGADNKLIHFKIYNKGAPLILSEVIPVLERMNLKVIGEHPYQIKTINGPVWVHDFELKSHLMLGEKFNELKPLFEDAFAHIWSFEAENDGFNGLVLAASIHWREVVMLRAYAAYMKQILFPFSKRAITTTLMSYPAITARLVELFHHLFDPSIKARRNYRITKAILNDLDEVKNLNDDRIIRRFLDMINGTLRTNFYQVNADGQAKEYLSFKFNPREIADIPEPRPQFEIFVYSSRVEGVHLRGSKVARGGLRWSDRNEDFRTEVLGLVKAQQVKNAVIVPNGAKGGFVAKKATMKNGRDSFLKEGISCYQLFIRGLLDLTDNLKEGKVIAPALVVRRDDDDPYMVVAADKGTATFSDIANTISHEYDHWLGDAFASGGSQGYDHKGMGITAKGAWVSVQRHFKEKGIDVQKQDFTVVGIGDMGGDVFGNGMLMSKHICLTAAFNHQHIFIDPTPNADKSFKERLRLFNTPGSSWDDYNRELISKGGGIFSRNAKSINISTEMKKCFDIVLDKLTPTDLISSLLKSPMDLIWNGGIGTYVKSAGETHTAIGDKANDALRVNGSELRCKVFGEGGNLGVSQQGRIEFALHGGACNTDFIDNAAGVDCSDHEVNIKILLNEEVIKGKLTEKQRNRLLARMTNTVSEMVLQNNYYQTQSISLAEKESLTRINEYRRLINSLEAKGKLNRALEFIPSDEELADRAANGIGLTRPELAVLNCYVKVQLKEELAVDEVANNDYLSIWVERAFPKQLLTKYKQQIHNHILRKEIIATQLANDMVDNMGITFCHRLVEATGETSAQVAIAYVIARDVFQFDDFQAKVEALDFKVPADDQLNLLIGMMRKVRRGTRWFLRNRRGHLDPARDVNLFEPLVAETIKITPKVMSETEKDNWKNKRQYFKNLGLNQDWSELMAMPSHLFSGLGIVEASLTNDNAINQAVEMHHLLGDKLGLYWFAHAVTDVHIESHWQAMARESFIDDIDKVLRVMTVNLLRLAEDKYQLEESLQLWMQENPQLVQRWRDIAHELQTNNATDFAMFSVAMRELMDLMEACRTCQHFTIN